MTNVHPLIFVTTRQGLGPAGVSITGVSKRGVPRIDRERSFWDGMIPSDGSGPETSSPNVVMETGRDAIGEGPPRGNGNISAVVIGPCKVRISHVLSWLNSLLPSLLEELSRTAAGMGGGVPEGDGNIREASDLQVSLIIHCVSKSHTCTFQIYAGLKPTLEHWR